jgi:hypothetical protein
MEKCDIKQELLDECFVYLQNGQDINPVRVREMITMAYNAGYKKGWNDRIIYCGKLPIPPERN